MKVIYTDKKGKFPETFIPDEKKLYFVYYDNKLNIVKRVHNNRGSLQFKLFTFDESFTAVYGICFNNSDNLEEFLLAIASHNGTIYECDSMIDFLSCYEEFIALVDPTREHTKDISFYK